MPHKKIKIYYAKTQLPNGNRPTVKEHCDSVSQYAALYGQPLGMEEDARLAGLLHDFGKYSLTFDDVMQGLRSGIDHALCGAALIWSLQKRPKGIRYRAVIEAINGHHDGLQYIGSISSALEANLIDEKPVSINVDKYSALNGKAQYQSAIDEFLRDHPDYRFPKLASNGLVGMTNLEKMLYTRMLFSCLVDADYSVSAFEANDRYFFEAEKDTFDAKRYLSSLYSVRESIKQNSAADPMLNRLRDDVFEQCGNCGESSSGGIFTLTAPTGTGKTLALLHFALRHARKTGKRRIIIVLPFLTLAEQNTRTYEQIIPEILVDHSQSELPETAWEFSSRWSVPFVITTSVKFFETLFSSRPTDCRKLHRIANSIVVFDEAQSLPPEVTTATLRAVKELCDRYHTTMVFSTATQPSFDAIRSLEWTSVEILPDYHRLYDALRRTKVEWHLQNAIPLDTIADEMSKQESVCAILNIRHHACKVYERLAQIGGASVYLLTTDLCPKHRSRIVREIKERIRTGLPCQVVATQCIEAGVDLDFKVMYRTLAPLESIIQAAGRCNRNGKLESGRVVVFIPDEPTLYPDRHYGNAAEIVRRQVAVDGIDINVPEHIDRYYRELFADCRDKRALCEAIDYFDYEKVDREYQLIKDTGVRLIVPYKGEYELYQRIKGEVLERGITSALMKQAAPITVNTFVKGELEKWVEPIYYRVKGKRSDQSSGYYVLRAQYEHCYSDEMGLQLKSEERRSEYTEFCF